MNLKDKIFSIASKKEFEKIALQVFRYQYNNNNVYQEYCNQLNRDISKIKKSSDIPFLPISMFKKHQIISGSDQFETIFESSGTTGIETSKHYIKDLDFYEESFLKTFQLFYGNPENYTLLALLPSYLERENSSLIYMVNYLLKRTKKDFSGFYLSNYNELINILETLDSKGENCILIGVTYALLDLIEIKKLSLKNTIVIETGGMKGRRKELIREELHSKLTKGLGVSSIHSEYGMTELLSQAYSLGKGIFELPPWMDIMIRDTEDPFCILDYNKNGGINVIDLANFHSCSFIATQDLGKKFKNQTFEVLGRFDHSDIRGCNLMVL